MDYLFTATVVWKGTHWLLGIQYCLCYELYKAKDWENSWSEGKKWIL